MNAALSISVRAATAELLTVKDVKTFEHSETVDRIDENGWAKMFNRTDQ